MTKTLKNKFSYWFDNWQAKKHHCWLCLHRNRTVLFRPDARNVPSGMAQYWTVAWNQPGMHFTLNFGITALYWRPKLLYPCIKSCTTEIMFYSVSSHRPQPFLRITLRPRLRHAAHDRPDRSSRLIDNNYYSIIIRMLYCSVCWRFM